MSIKIITEFELSKKKPLDNRLTVADSTARLAIKWIYKGLRVKDLDTGKWYEYVGDETTNIAGDWRRTINSFTGTAAPGSSLGDPEDVFIDTLNRVFYLKTDSTTWTAQFTFDGSQILTSVGTPNDVDGQNGDINIDDSGNVYKKAAGTWGLQFSIKGADGADGDRFATTSTSSIDLDTASAPIAITVDTGLAWTAGQEVEVVSSADLNNNVTGTVESYDSGTGAMSITSITISGTGAHTDWVVNLAGAAGKQGKAFIHTESDITLTQAKITSVQSGGYTSQSPWSASVLNDTRSASELVATSGIIGNKAGHSIAYDGTTWHDNGTWRGPTGSTGATGTTGATGATGPAGANGVFNASDFWDGSTVRIFGSNGISDFESWDFRFRKTKAGIIYYAIRAYRGGSGSRVRTFTLPSSIAPLQENLAAGVANPILVHLGLGHSLNNFSIGGDTTRNPYIYKSGSSYILRVEFISSYTMNCNGCYAGSGSL